MVVTGERVGQSLQRGVGVASESRHDRDQDHTLRQADDQRGHREAGHAAQVDPPRAKMADQATHGQREKGGGGALQEQAEAAHPNACKQNRNKRLNQLCYPRTSAYLQSFPVGFWAKNKD